MSEQNTGSGYGTQQIKVHCEQVVAKTQALKSRTETEADRIGTEYGFLTRKLGSRDGFTNAALIDVAKENERKALTTARVLDKLSLFIVKAAEHAEKADNANAAQFISGR